MRTIRSLFESELVVGNLGTSLFADSLRIQGTPVMEIDDGVYAVPLDIGYLH